MNPVYWPLLSSVKRFLRAQKLFYTPRIYLLCKLTQKLEVLDVRVRSSLGTGDQADGHERAVPRGVWLPHGDVRNAASQQPAFEPQEA